MSCASSVLVSVCALFSSSHAWQWGCVRSRGCVLRCMVSGLGGCSLLQLVAYCASKKMGVVSEERQALACKQAFASCCVESSCALLTLYLHAQSSLWLLPHAACCSSRTRGGLTTQSKCEAGGRHAPRILRCERIKYTPQHVTNGQFGLKDCSRLMWLAAVCLWRQAWWQRPAATGTGSGGGAQRWSRRQQWRQPGQQQYRA